MFDTFLISFYGYAATGMYKGDNNAKDKIDALSEYLNTIYKGQRASLSYTPQTSKY